MLVPLVEPDEAGPAGNAQDEDSETETSAWREALKAPFDQIEKFDLYVHGVSQLDTHRGVKGLEFPRVVVVISYAEAKGFLFNYGKLFGIKPKTKADLDNEAAGKDTSIDRTRRLCYVTCSRSEESLAVVYYSDNSEVVREGLIDHGWFRPEEIEIVA